MTEETIKALAEGHADSIERRGCSLWSGLFRGYESGYKAALSGTEAMKVLESLTPGGSEYYNDPKACAEFVRDNRDGLHKQIVDLTRKLKAGTERVECYLPVNEPTDLCVSVYHSRDEVWIPEFPVKKVTLTVIPNHQ